MKLVMHSIVAVMILLIGLSGSVAAQSPYRLSEKEMTDLLKRIDGDVSQQPEERASSQPIRRHKG